ncbi:hypothetical protein Tco_0738881 [Tanacetum coccineum]
MKEKIKDLIAIEKKVNFVPISYGKLKDLYETFVPQVELSLEQFFFPEASISNVTPTKASTSSSLPLKMPKSTFVNLKDSFLRRFCYDEEKPILDYLQASFKVIQKEFLEDVQVMMNVLESIESELDETLT